MRGARGTGEGGTGWRPEVRAPLFLCFLTIETWRGGGGVVATATGGRPHRAAASLLEAGRRGGTGRGELSRFPALSRSRRGEK